MKQLNVLAILLALILSIEIHGQTPIPWYTTGNNVSSGEWFGADGLSSDPLQIRHENNQPIQWYTAWRRKMQLYPWVLSQIHHFPGIEPTGFLGLSGTEDFFTNTVGPFSRLHLANDDDYNASEWGFRPWQRNGVTFTGNGDQA